MTQYTLLVRVCFLLNIFSNNRENYYRYVHDKLYQYRLWDWTNDSGLLHVVRCNYYGSYSLKSKGGFMNMKIMFILVPSLLKCFRVSLVWWPPLSQSIHWGPTWQRSTAKIVQNSLRMPRSSPRNTVKSDPSTDEARCWPPFCFLFEEAPWLCKLHQNALFLLFCIVLALSDHSLIEARISVLLCQKRKQDFLVNRTVLANKCHLLVCFDFLLLISFFGEKKSEVKRGKKEKCCSPYLNIGIFSQIND